MSDLKHQAISESILGAAMTVLNTLRPGLDEKLYERALVIELRKRGHQVQQQRSFNVLYDHQHIGTLVPDILVDETAVVEVKVVAAFNETHSAQILGYLNITGYSLGLLINFKYARLKWKRFIN